MKWCMKKVLVIVGILLVGVLFTSAQEDEPKVCINQSAANRCASAVQELIAARDVISNFQAERSASQAERAAAAKVIEGFNSLVSVKDRVIAGYEQINTLYKQVIQLQAEIIEKYQKQLMKGKSAFSKLLDALKTLLYFAAGAALGRGL